MCIYEDKHHVHRGKDCMKTFCEFLREYVMKIINFKKKKMSYYQMSSKRHKKVQKSIVLEKGNLKINI